MRDLSVGCVIGVRVVALDGLDLRVGRQLHVGRAEERRARVAARDAEDDAVHQVLDERPGDHDAHVDGARLSGHFGRPGIALGLARVHIADTFGQRQPLFDRKVCCHVIFLTFSWERRIDQLGRLGDFPLGGQAVFEDAARGDGVRPRDAHVAVRLLVVDEQVAREHLVVQRVDLRRLHDVELADLGRAREHLDRVLVVRDLERLRREDAAAAEGLGLDARDAGLESGGGRRAALLVPGADRRHVRARRTLWTTRWERKRETGSERT